jgi:hypothetical protein
MGTTERDTELETEARATYTRYVAARSRVEAGEASWASLGDFFTDDAVFIDPAWGRTQGRDALLPFFEESMAGLDTWTFPEAWTMVEGTRIVSFWWNRLPGTRPDGSPIQAPGVSILHYAGDGRFSYELDVLNMAEVMECITDSGWVPSGPMNLPPKQPDRSPTPPDGSIP